LHGWEEKGLVVGFWRTEARVWRAAGAGYFGEGVRAAIGKTRRKTHKSDGDREEEPDTSPGSRELV